MIGGFGLGATTITLPIPTPSGLYLLPIPLGTSIPLPAPSTKMSGGQVTLVPSTTAPSGNAVFAGTASDGQTYWAVPADPAQGQQETVQTLQTWANQMSQAPGNQPPDCTQFWDALTSPSCSFSDYLSNVLPNPSNLLPSTNTWLIVAAIALGGLFVVSKVLR